MVYYIYIVTLQNKKKLICWIIMGVIMVSLSWSFPLIMTTSLMVMNDFKGSAGSLSSRVAASAVLVPTSGNNKGCHQHLLEGKNPLVVKSDTDGRLLQNQQVAPESPSPAKGTNTRHPMNVTATNFGMPKPKEGNHHHTTDATLDLQQSGSQNVTLMFSRPNATVYMDYNNTFVLVRYVDVASNATINTTSAQLRVTLLNKSSRYQYLAPLHEIISLNNSATGNEWNWNVTFPVENRAGYFNGTYVLEFEASAPGYDTARANFTLQVLYNDDLEPPEIYVDIDNSSPTNQTYVFNPLDPEPQFVRVTFRARDNRGILYVSLKANDSFAAPLIGGAHTEFHRTYPNGEETYVYTTYITVNASLLAYRTISDGNEGIYYLRAWVADFAGNEAVSNVTWKIYSDTKGPEFNVTWPASSSVNPISRHDITIQWQYLDPNPNMTFKLAYDSDFNGEEDKTIIFDATGRSSYTFTIEWTSNDVDPFYLEQGWWPTAVSLEVRDSFGNMNYTGTTLWIILKAEDLPSTTPSTSARDSGSSSNAPSSSPTSIVIPDSTISSPMGRNATADLFSFVTMLAVIVLITGVILNRLGIWQALKQRPGNRRKITYKSKRGKK